MSAEIIHVERGSEVHLVGRPADWAAAAEGPGPEGWRIVRHRLRPTAERGRGVMFAGPWIGEFGWELARWQGGLRKLARESGLYAVVMGDAGHGLLYEWANEYWETPAGFWADGMTRQCDHVRGDPEKIAPRLRRLAAAAAQQLEGLGDVGVCVTPRRFKIKEQEIARLAADGPWSAEMRRGRGYFCVVPRLRDWNRRKNWSPTKWQALVGALARPGLAAAVVGTPAELAVLSPADAMPERRALAHGVNLLSYARFAVASESGGALLALLCGCPSVVMGHPRQERRITQTENFFRTPVRYLGRPGYNFTVAEVADACRAFM